MTPIWIVAAALAAPSPPTAEPCPPDPELAIERYSESRVDSTAARRCLGLAYVEIGRFLPAALTFEQAAGAVGTPRDPIVRDLLMLAGNAYLLGGKPQQARAAFDSVLAHITQDGPGTVELYIDRARASVDMGDLPGARSDLDLALAGSPENAMGWLLSASLARRQNDLERANADIERAEHFAPKDAAVLVEAGNLAALAGNYDVARSKWTAAIAHAPGSAAANSAAAALAANADDE